MEKQETKSTETQEEEVSLDSIDLDIRYIANTIGFNMFKSEMLTNEDGKFYLDAERTKLVFETAAKVLETLKYLGYNK